MRRRVAAMVLAVGALAVIVPGAAHARPKVPTCVRVPITKHAQIQIGYC